MSSVNGDGHYGANGAAPQAAPFRPPPHNIEAEQSVLGSLLMDADVLPAVLAKLKVADFYRDTHQILFEAIAALHGKGEPVDGITLCEELARRDQLERIGGPETLEELVNSVPTSANALYHAAIVREKAIARDLVDRATDLLNNAYSNNFTAEELLSSAEQGIASIGDASAREDAEDFSLRPWPDEPDDAIWYGLAGDIVRKIAPQTESDRMAILGQFLVAFGNVIGRKPHWNVDASRHGCNLFLCIVGNSAKARKGTSWDIVRWLLKGCDPDWNTGRILGGLSSGEGMIWSVRDQIIRREKQGTLGFQDVVADPGVDDKRALFVETEFGSTLAVLGREGNTLSGYIRKAWDSGDLSSVVKNNPARTTGSHISVIAHITVEELHRRLTQTDAANGFANRFLWLCARRSRYLPEGGDVCRINWTHEARRLNDAVSYARGELETEDGFVLVRDEQARQLWHEAYPALSEPKPGLYGAVISRAEAQVMRLASIYALLDTSSIIHYAHLKAALALWRYCEQSAAYVFGDALGVPNADRVLHALEEAEEGLSPREILRVVFRGHQPREPQGGVKEILASLSRAGLVECETVATGGRPTTRWKRTRKNAEEDTATKAPKAPKGGGA